LKRRIRSEDRVVILAGSLYREHVVPLLKRHGCEVEVPMRGLGSANGRRGSYGRAGEAA
jgi:hypothetical protein